MESTISTLSYNINKVARTYCDGINQGDRRSLVAEVYSPLRCLWFNTDEITVIIILRDDP